MYRQTINLKDAPPNPDLNRNIPAQKLIKTSQIPGESAEKESKYRRVAKFLILIGSEQAAGILSGLDREQVDLITREIALIKIIRPEEKNEIMAEFHALFSGERARLYKVSGSSSGGIETARKILYASKGPKKGEEILNRAVPGSKENLFSFLEEYSVEQLDLLLKTESAQTTALILSYLPPKLSAGIISKLHSDVKAEVLKRIAHQGEVSPEVLEQVSAGLKEKVRHISGAANDYEIDGMKTLAAILKQGEYSFSDRLLNELEEDNPQIGRELKDKLYTLEDVINAVDRPIQDKLTMMSEYEIAILLKGRGDEFTEKIMSCVSAGRRKLIREESEMIGAASRRECDKAAREFLSWFRYARERGDIIFYNDEDVFL